MGLLAYPECGDDVSETAATARPRQPRHSRKIHPITWIVAAALIPILVWDVRQTVRESKSHSTSPPAAAHARAAGVARSYN